MYARSPLYPRVPGHRNAHTRTSASSTEALPAVHSIGSVERSCQGESVAVCREVHAIDLPMRLSLARERVSPRFLLGQPKAPFPCRQTRAQHGSANGQATGFSFLDAYSIVNGNTGVPCDAPVRQGLDEARGPRWAALHSGLNVRSEASGAGPGALVMSGTENGKSPRRARAPSGYSKNEIPSSRTRESVLRAEARPPHHPLLFRAGTPPLWVSSNRFGNGELGLRPHRAARAHVR